MAEKLVVYDSFFGNTAKVAEAVAEAIGGTAKKVSDVEKEDLMELKVLFVGSPTRAFRPTPAIMSWLKSIRGSVDGVKGSVFDTRFPIESAESGFLRFLIKLFDYANPKMVKQLTKAGVEIVLEPQGFAVLDSEGPLAEGELDRAKAWAAGILKI
jgi:flavodoxin